METKKILVPFDLSNPEKNIKGFLYPNINLEQVDAFIDIDKGKEWKTGMVVFVGRPITENDIFAKIVNSGKKIKLVNGMLGNIESYLKQISSYKIGDIVGIRPSLDGFELIKLEKPQNRRNRFCN